MSIHRAGRLAVLAASCVAAVALLAACGGGSKPASASVEPTNSGAAGFQAYLACLSQHGVTLPSQSARPRPTGSFTRSPGAGGFGGGRGAGGGFPGGGGFGGGFNFDPNNPPAGVDQATWSAALTACQSLRPALGNRGGGNNFNNSAFTAYRNCLSDHGMKFPSTGAGGGGFNFNTADPTTAAALKACAPLRPTGRPTAAPSPSG